MKKKLFVILLALTVVCFGVFLLKKKPNIANQPSSPSLSNVGNTNSESGSTIPSTRPPNISEADWRYLLSLRDRMLQVNQPVEFYARVVDQSGNAIPGAALELHLWRTDSDRVLRTFPNIAPGQEQEMRTTILVSDPEGWIQLKGVTGHVLDIEGLTKEGYFWSRPRELGSLIFEPSGKRNASGKVIEISDAMNSSKGYTFHLWKRGTTEPLIRSGVTVSLPRPKTNAVVNLVTGTLLDSFDGGDLAIFVEFLYPNDPNRPADRRIHFLGLNGTELAESKEPYPFFAFQEGYTNNVYYDVLPSTGYGPSGSWNWSKNFYVALRSAHIYGEICIDFDSGEMLFRITSTLNPAGSRNLEIDPDKLIFAPEELSRIDKETRRR